ncbi:MAG: Rieske 2Fe-2S domain-containing protein, partial [Burkholderiales bacterium]
MASTASLGAAAYSQGDWFMQEKTSLFARAWVPICADQQIRERGQFASATVGGWPLVALRNDAGRVVGLRNTCKHQSMMVVEQAAGQCDVLRCRYHGWTYDLDGRFKSAPPLVAP